MGSKKSYSNEFKQDAVKYCVAHEEMSVEKCAENLGVSSSALRRWLESSNQNNGAVVSRGSGNYASDEQKEIAKLKRELRDTKDALEILKKAIGILGE